MRALDYSQILEVAERGISRSLAERALLMLEAASPDESWESLQKLSIGQRDDLLLALRQQTFGSQLQGLADCPRCGLTLSADLNIDSMRDGGEKCVPESTATVGEYEIRFRCPNSEDLIAMAQVADADNRSLELLERCVLDARFQGQPVPLRPLPEKVREQVDRLIEQSDPQSELRLAMECPSCSHSWCVIFDIVTFLWSEIVARARQLLLEVHTLASAYGWSEERILQLSPWRRGLYLAMVS